MAPDPLPFHAVIVCAIGLLGSHPCFTHRGVHDRSPRWLGSTRSPCRPLQGAAPYCTSPVPFTSPDDSSPLPIAPGATMASADFSRRWVASPFQAQARSPQVRPLAFPAPPPDLRPRPLVARASRSVARSPWVRPPRIRFLFVGSRVRSPLPSALPSRTSTLRFAWVPATKSPEDLHLLVSAHAGHTTPRAPRRTPALAECVRM